MPVTFVLVTVAAAGVAAGFWACYLWSICIIRDLEEELARAEPPASPSRVRVISSSSWGPGSCGDPLCSHCSPSPLQCSDSTCNLCFP